MATRDRKEKPEDDLPISTEPLAGKEPPPARRIGFWLGPLLCLAVFFSSLPAGLSVEAWRLVGLVVWMAVWWASEAVPVPATSLLPLLYLPVAGIAGFKAAAAPYAEPVIFLLLGGFVMAMALTRWELHRRFALYVIAAFGRRPRALLLGFMAATALISMWISNTASTLMMMPIALSVASTVLGERMTRHPFAIALLLGVAYSASIGGLGTKIGTPPNAFVVGFLEDASGLEISFTQWMAFAVPIVAIMVPAAWALLAFGLYRFDPDEVRGAEGVVRRLRDALPAMSTPERRTACVFALVAVMWASGQIWRQWWSPLAPLRDSWIAIFGALLMFVLPAGGRTARGERLLDWDSAVRLPWGVILLFGGGLSLARAVESTGLAVWLGGQIAPLAQLPPLLLVFGIVTLVIFLTELTSNTATVAALVPVITALADARGADVSPLLLAVPLAMAGSCAFMLPVATGPNAIVYASATMRVADMAKAGFWLNLIAIVVITGVSLVILPRLL